MLAIRPKSPSMGRKRRKKMGRPPKPAEKVKSEWIAFAVEPARAAAYREAAEKSFKGVMSDFARDACDALAAKVASEKPPVKPDPPKE
jgi:hypothetical protein